MNSTDKTRTENYTLLFVKFMAENGRLSSFQKYDMLAIRAADNAHVSCPHVDFTKKPTQWNYGLFLHAVRSEFLGHTQKTH